MDSTVKDPQFRARHGCGALKMMGQAFPDCDCYVEWMFDRPTRAWVVTLHADCGWPHRFRSVFLMSEIQCQNFRSEEEFQFVFEHCVYEGIVLINEEMGNL